MCTETEPAAAGDGNNPEVWDGQGRCRLLRGSAAVRSWYLLSEVRGGTDNTRKDTPHAATRDDGKTNRS